MAQLTDLHSQPNYKSEKKSLINLSPIFNLFLTTPNIGYFICDLGIFLAQSATKVGGFNGLIVTSRRGGGDDQQGDRRVLIWGERIPSDWMGEEM